MTVTPIRAMARHAEPVPVDLSSLDRQELTVVLFAAGCRWETHQSRSHTEMARLVVDQLNALGLPTVRDIASRVRTAAATSQWFELESLLPGDDNRSDANALAVKFLCRQRRDSTLGTWQRHITSVVAA
jgi:hypothetical protein